MPFSTLLGNEPAKAALTRMAMHHRVPHTLLFAGPDGVGKGSFALAFAALLMGPKHAPKIESGNHPDVHLYYPEGKAHIHPMEAMRTLIDEVAMPPFEAPVKVFILHEAHQMLPSSSNALLKTLEEPPSDSIFILLTSQPEALLPTIVSRCRTVPFFPIPEPQLAAYCEQQLHQSPDVARKTAFLSQGSLAKARALAAQTNDEIKTLVPQLLQHGTTPYAQFLKLCTQLEAHYGLGKAEQEEAADDSDTPQVDELFEEIATWYRDMHLIAQGADRALLYHRNAPAPQGPLPPLESVLEAISRSRLALQRHVKLRFVLEELLFSLGR